MYLIKSRIKVKNSKTIEIEHANIIKSKIDEKNTIDKHISNFNIGFYKDKITASWEYIQALEPGWILLFELAITDKRNIVQTVNVTGRSFVNLDRSFLTKEHYILTGILKLLIPEGNEIKYSQTERDILYTEDTAFDYIISEYERLFTHRSGTIITILTVRHGGEPCPKCYNPTMKKSTNPHCDLCLGTGYLKGYNEPIETLGMLVQLPNETKVQNPNLQHARSWNIMIPANIKINEGDLIFLNENGVLLKVAEVMPIRWGVVPVLYRVMATVYNNPKIFKLFNLQQKQKSRPLGPTID